MDILVLGGTGWLGGEMVREALRRGHDVTCLARGSGPAPEGAHLVRADRDEPQALAPVAGRRWDAVVDVTDQPGRVREAVRELRTAHWVYVSSASVYAESREVDRSEDAPVLEPLAADRYEDMGDYGAAKLACERAILTGGTPAAVVRAGLIGGPGDESGRSGYWPWRFAHPSGPDVLVPDDPDLPTALVDVRDLARWLVAVAETGTAGVSTPRAGRRRWGRCWRRPGRWRAETSTPDPSIPPTCSTWGWRRGPARARCRCGSRCPSCVASPPSTPRGPAPRG